MAVYMIREMPDGFVKIGRATIVADRLAALQTGNPRPLVVIRTFEGADFVTETWLHRLFGAKRVTNGTARCEWFSYDDSMLTVTPPVEQTEGDFRYILNQWPDRGAIAEDCGVPYMTAQMWATRNRVPGDHFRGLVEGAKRRGIEGITFELLHSLLAAPSKSEAA